MFPILKIFMKKMNMFLPNYDEIKKKERFTKEMNNNRVMKIKFIIHFKLKLIKKHQKFR